jgi:two-component system nitrogen regulation sensor histidine kinase NtrY
MSRPLIRILLAALALVLSFSIQEPNGDAYLVQVTEKAQKDLLDHRRALGSAAQRWADRLQRIGPDNWMIDHIQELEAEHRRTGTLFLGYLDDSLVCWSGQVPVELSKGPPSSKGSLELTSATYLHEQMVRPPYTLVALRPLLLTPTIENAYLKHRFHPSLRIPASITAASPDSSPHILHDFDDQALLALQLKDGALELGPWIIQRMALLIVGIILLVAALWSGFLRPTNSWGGRTAAFAFILVTLFLRWVQLIAVPTSPFDRLPLFDPAIYATSMAFPSLGDMVLNAGLLLTMVLFTLKVTSIHREHERPRPYVIILLWATVLLFGAWTTQLIIGLVDNSSVDLDLFHIEGLSLLSALALLAIAMLHAAWWVGALIAMRVTWSAGSSRPWAIPLGVFVVSVVIHHLVGELDTVLFLWPLPILAILLWAKGRQLRFVQAVLTVALFAATTAHLLIKYTRHREERERPVLAERLAVREDPVVELLFRGTAPLLRSDQALNELLVRPTGCDATLLDQQVRQRFFNGYWERFDVRLFALDAIGNLRCATTSAPPLSSSLSVGAFNDPLAMADMPDLFIEEQPGRSPFYHARIAVMANDTTASGQLILEIHPRSTAQGPGFPDLLISGEDPLDRRTERYGMARYEGGQLAERSGHLDHPRRWTRHMPTDHLLWYTDQGYRCMAKGDPQGTLIVLATLAPSLLDQATTFSYLFALFGVLVLLALALRSIGRNRGPVGLGIGAKVRLALLLFTIVGLVFFGLGTQRLLTEQFEQRTQATVLQKARSVAQELQQRFAGETRLSTDQAGYLDHLLARASNVFFTDITVHGLDGRLLSTSRPQVFSSGLLGPLMDPMAYSRLALNGSSGYVHEEQIGTANYSSAYVPLNDRDGRTMAYVSLPSFADRVQLEEERAGVLIAVVNLFVLFFALSVLVAVFISNWTTRPLDLLKNALSRVALQGANVPIRYQGNDEVGQLVEVYNRKVEELRASAELLARSERESAWREMARQVAHEIKNPLTPMKLSIQHFQRTWKPDAPDAAERLERFSRGLVEQIDTLSGIAGAFSNFAQLPKARPEPLDLAQVAEAAVSVFQAMPGLHCTLERLSEQPQDVLADRDHLMRVFNNLLKNAQQAIPEDRAGRVEVRLRSTDTEAIAEVRDNGTGIAEKDRERIFRPNFTTKSSGMGLGLAMVQRMVESAGGRVWFESREGAGSSFFVALPLRK